MGLLDRIAHRLFSIDITTETANDILPGPCLKIHHTMNIWRRIPCANYHHGLDLLSWFQICKHTASTYRTARSASSEGCLVLGSRPSPKDQSFASIVTSAVIILPRRYSRRLESSSHVMNACSTARSRLCDGAAVYSMLDRPIGAIPEHSVHSRMIEILYLSQKAVPPVYLKFLVLLQRFGSTGKRARRTLHHLEP